MPVTGLTVENARVDGRPVGLRAAEGLIAALGPDVTPQPGDRVIDAGGMALEPPLVNGHTHAAMTLFRGFGDDLPLMEWLETRIWPAEQRLTEDDVYWGTRLAALEMVRSGTTHFFDMYWHGAAVARAAEDAGVRATVSAVLIDGLDPSRSRALRENAARSLDELARFGALITPSLGPHAIYTVSDESLRWVADTAAAREVPVHIHLAETRPEVDDCMTAHGMRPVEYVDRLGLLGPRTLLAHGCWLTPDELGLVADRGATIVTNPVSNLKLAAGRIFPYLEAASLGVAIGLGTDGASSNNSLDLFQDLKVLALVQKHAAEDPSVVPAGEALEIAQGRRSPLMGGRALEVGAPADFLLVRSDRPELTPGDLTAGLVYAATGTAVDTTVVAGRVLMHDRVVEDEAEILAEARHRAERLTDFVD